MRRRRWISLGLGTCRQRRGGSQVPTLFHGLHGSAETNATEKDFLIGSHDKGLGVRTKLHCIRPFSPDSDTMPIADNCGCASGAGICTFIKWSRLQ